MSEGLYEASISEASEKIELLASMQNEDRKKKKGQVNRKERMRRRKGCRRGKSIEEVCIEMDLIQTHT